jgi:hypothetical protein
VDSASGVSGAHLTLIFETELLRHGREEHLRHHSQRTILAKGQRFPLPDGAVIGLGPKVKLQFWFTPKP